VPLVPLAVVGVVATDAVLTEIGVLGADQPPDGLGPDTLQTTVYQAAVKRKSVNQSTFTDNQNLIKYIPEAAFSKGKLAALDAIKNGATESEAINQGQAAANSHFATIEENFLKSWNESAAEFGNSFGALQSHPDLSPMDAIGMTATDSNTSMNESNVASGSWNITTRDVQLSDGSSFTVKSVQTPQVGMHQGNDGGFGAAEFDPLRLNWFDLTSSMNDYGGWFYLDITAPSGTVSRYLDTETWNSVWSSMQSTFDDILNNISVWVSNTYSGIQTGEISPDQYLSATDLANSISSNSAQAQAIGNLLALNVPGAYEHELTLEFSDGTTCNGFVATTSSTNVPKLTAGTSINPDATDADGNRLYETWYLAFRPGSYIEPIDYFDGSYGIQGGTIRFTSDPTSQPDGQPLDAVEYVVETSKGETARVVPSDFTKETIDSSTYWTADLSAKLSETIADVSRVRRVYAGEKPDTYALTTVNQPFTIAAIDGADSVTVQQHRPPQTDSNYVSDEEWTAFGDTRDELIDRFNDAGSGAGGASWGDQIPDLGILPDAIPGNKYLEWFGVVVLGLLGVNVVNSIAN